MTDQEEEGSADNAAARAFRDLHAEVIVMRRLVEGLPHDWEDKRPPDYSPDLGVIRKTLIAMEQRLGVIEAQPALKQTPESYAVRVENAGQSVFREAERVLGRAISETRNTGSKLAAMIGDMRGQEEQRDFVLFWGSIAAGCALLLGLVGSPFIASHLPFGWKQDVAALVMGQSDRWDAGVTLLRESHPKGWNILVADWKLISGNQANAKAIAACRVKAATLHGAVSCPVIVTAGE